MNVVIVCQNCRKPLKIPVEGLGQKVRCPACQTIFVGKRDEFKPRTEVQPSPLPAPVNDAILSDEDAAPTDEAFEDAAYESPRHLAPPKKKSNLWIILILLLGLFAFAVLVCVGVVVAYLLFV